jgi:hypothetical protein
MDTCEYRDCSRRAATVLELDLGAGYVERHLCREHAEEAMIACDRFRELADSLLGR